MLKEGYHMSPSGGQEELEEVQSDLRKKEEEVTLLNIISLSGNKYNQFFIYFSMKKMQVQL